MITNHSKFVYASALVLSLAMTAGAAEARKRVTHDWHKNPAAYAPDGLGDYGVEKVKQTAQKVAVSRKSRKPAKVRTARKGGIDWHKNPAAYAPDGLTDYGTIVVRKLDANRPVEQAAEPKRAKGRPDWFSNPTAYAPDGLTAYGVVKFDLKAGPNA